MNDDIKHKMFSDPVTLVSQSQLLMLVETIARGQKSLYSLISTLTDKGLVTAELLTLMNELHDEQHWVLRWADDKIKSLGSEVIDDRTDQTYLQ